MPIEFLSTWRKSSRCETQACVEVAQADGAVGIRNSTTPEHQLAFRGKAWSEFIGGVRAGQFHDRG